jgi:hypothetical protein
MIWFLLLSVLTSFVSAFVKNFQTKNVAGDHKKLAFVTAYAYAALDVATVALIIRGGWIIALTSGTGAAFGVIAAMHVHGKVVKSHE